MPEQVFSKIRIKLEDFRVEILIGASFSVPILLFILIAWIRGDFTIVDHTYWISVIAYNLAIIAAILVGLSNRTLKISPVILYYAIGLSLFAMTVFNQIMFAGDITQGVIAGARILWEGENPYVVEKVPHAKPNSPGEFRWTTYAYLPVDLLTYTILLGLMNTISSLVLGGEIPTQFHDFIPGFSPMGIFLANLLFMVISIFLIQKILEIDLKNAILLGTTLFLILLWNNVCLAQTLFIAGWYFHKREQNYITVVFWTLSMLTKYFTGIFIVAYIVDYLRKKEFVKSLIMAFITVILTFIFIFPFGVIQVLKSTVFFYNTEERILDGSFGGSIVSELVLLLNLVDIVWIFTLFGFLCILIIALLIEDLHQRCIITSLLALCVITGMSPQFFLMIVFIFIVSTRILLFVPDEEGYSTIKKTNETIM
ncbi:MAG: hypothetical protein ACFFDT_37330 [Candidatus Hodarchaeota archaeon]